MRAHEGDEIISLQPEGKARKTRQLSLGRDEQSRAFRTYDSEPRKDELDGLVDDEHVKEELPDEGVVRAVEVVWRMAEE